MILEHLRKPKSLSEKQNWIGKDWNANKRKEYENEKTHIRLANFIIERTRMA